MCTCTGQSRTSTDAGHAHVQGSPEPLQTLGVHLHRAVQNLYRRCVCTCTGQSRTSKDAGCAHAQGSPEPLQTLGVHMQGSPEPLKTLGVHMRRAVQNLYRHWVCTCAGQSRTSKDNGHAHAQGSPETLKTIGMHMCRAVLPSAAHPAW